MIRRWYQFSMLAILVCMVGLGGVIVAIRKCPHYVIFLLSVVCFALACRSTYRNVKASQLWRASLFAAASLATFVVLCVVSIGPFIALSELEYRVTGQSNLKRIGGVYRPVMVLYAGHFATYVNHWIPANAPGLRTAWPPDDRLRPMVGTWKGTKGNLLNFRSDGTARWRSTSGFERGYMEWAFDGSRFQIWQYGDRDTAYAWFGRAGTELAPTERYQVIEITEDTLELRNLRDTSGTPSRFQRTQDEDLERAP